MERNLKWRALLVGVVLVTALIYIFPSISPTLPTWWQKFLPTDTVNLGLDLRGGMHLILEVQAEKAVESALERTIEELKYNLRKGRVAVRDIHRVGESGISIELTKADDEGKFIKIMSKDFEYFDTGKALVKEQGLLFNMEISAAESKRIRDLAVRQALETIRNRIDQFGVSEPDIRPQGVDRIIVQLPGIKDTKRALDLIGQTAMLEFKLVDESTSPERALTAGAPAGTEIAYKIEVDPETGRSSKTAFLLRKRALMTGESITDARLALDSTYNTPYVTLSFDAKGSRQFERITEAHTKKRLAIVLDGIVKSAPVIQEKISGGRASITGQFTQEEARDLAIVLRAGALPAPVEFLENRTVGPSLGQDSINKGFNSILIGGVIVLIFMAFYYKASGLIADTALLINILLIMAVLVAFKATLTLPGIAGIILTIGMSVDANVLIFERIREELRLGKSPRAAIDGGFGKALWTILDANITTLIVALVLFQFGTSTIRGFAVTLSIGILASLFTAIFVSRIIFDFLLVKVKVSRISV